MAILLDDDADDKDEGFAGPLPRPMLDVPLRMAIVRDPHEPTWADVRQARWDRNREREQILEEDMARSQDEQLNSELLDSATTQRLALALHKLLPDLAMDDCLEAAAVAVRLHDPRWQTISRYRAAVAIQRHLEYALRDAGLLQTWAMPDRTQLRLNVLSDKLAGLGHQARRKAWNGHEPVTAREWCKARNNLLCLREDL